MSTGKNKRAFVSGCLAGVALGVCVCIAAGALAAWILPERLTALRAKNLRVPPITTGLEADYDWQATALDGGVLDMAETRGRAVFLNFWRPDCPLCIAEAPSINRLHEMLKDENVVFVSILLDKDVGNPRIAVEQEGITYPVYTIEGKPPEVFVPNATPTTFLIAPNGDIVFKHTGGAKWDDASVVALLRDLSRHKAPLAQ